jgi:hypothetical protein
VLAQSKVPSTEAEASRPVPWGSGHPCFPTCPDHRAKSRAGGALGAVALCEAGAGEIVDPGWSDCQGQLVEGGQDPEVYCFFGPEFVVAAADVWMNACPALITRAQRSCFSPRIGRSRDFTWPWSDSIRLLA